MHQKKSKLLLPPFPILLLMVVMFGIISAITSGIGAYNLINLKFDWLYSTILASTFTTVIQIAIVALVFALFSKLGRVLTLLVLLALLPLWFLSIATASGSWWFVFRADSYENALNLQRQNQMIKPLIKLQTQSNRVVGTMNAIKQHAVNMATIEDTTGKSCGYFASKGKGPRYRMRIRQQNSAKQFANASKSVNNRVVKVVKDARANGTSGFFDTYSKANAILNDNNLIEMKSWLVGVSEGLNSSFTDPSTLAKFKCSDPKLSSLINSALLTFEDLPQLPDVPPNAADVSMQDALILSYQRLLPISFANSGYSEEVNSATPQDYLPLIPAFIIEFCLFVIAAVRSILLRRIGYLHDDIDHFFEFQQENDPEFFVKLDNFVRGKGGHYSAFDILDRLVMPVSNTDFLVVPLDGDEKIRDKALRVVQYLEPFLEKTREKPVYGFPTAELKDWFLQSRGGDIGNSKFVHLYPLPAEFKNWRRKKIREYVYSHSNPNSTDPNLKVVG